MAMMELDKIHLGDALKLSKMLSPGSVNLIVSSPPYWSVRDYEIEGQLGLERMPEDFVNNLCDIFSNLWDALDDRGSMWLNLGDTFWGGKGQSGSEGKENRRGKKAAQPMQSKIGKKGWTKPSDGKHPHIKPKDLIGIPWMVAFELRKRGWYLRSENIWHKTNGFPDAVNDRTDRVHEHIFQFTKIPSGYYFDGWAMGTPYAPKTETTRGKKNKTYANNKGLTKTANWYNSIEENKPKEWRRPDGTTATGRANRKSVWPIAVKKNKGNHPAVFPTTIPDLIIKGCCPPGGVVLDPFMGDGTTAIVAQLLGRKWIGFEISPAYLIEAEARLGSPTQNRRIKSEAGQGEGGPPLSMQTKLF